MQSAESRLTPQWCPICPICSGPGLRDPRRLALDCTCQLCGWHYTSRRSRSLLRALTGPTRENAA